MYCEGVRPIIKLLMVLRCALDVFWAYLQSLLNVGLHFTTGCDSLLYSSKHRYDKCVV